MKSRCLNSPLSFTLFLAWMLALSLQAEEAVKKAPVPSSEAQAKAEKLIKEVYKESYENRDPANLRTLATVLFQEGKEARNDLVARFVLFREASDLAAQAGDIALAFEIVGGMAREYALDPADRKAAVLTAVAHSDKAPDSKELTEIILDAVDEAVAGDSYEAAGRLLTLAGEVARKTKSVALISRVEKRSEEVQALHKVHASLRKAAATLQTKPDDPDANLLVGRALCFQKGEWSKGLPMLAKGSDARLKALAQKDLDQQKEPDAQVEVADSWWDLADAEQGAPRVHLRRRASYWYQQALRTLTGEAQTRAESRVEAANVVNESRRLTGHTDRIHSVGFSADGRRVLSGGEDRVVNLWDLDTGKALNPLTSLLRYYDSRSGAYQDPIVTHLILSPEGRRAIFAGKGRAVVHDLDAGKRLLELETEMMTPTALTLSADGRRLLMGRDPGLVRLLDVDSGRELRRFDTSRRSVLAFSPDMQRALTLSKDPREVLLWNVETGEPLQPFDQLHLDEVRCAAFSPNGRLAVTGGADRVARVHDVERGRQLHRLAGHKGEVLCVAFTPDGRHVLTGSADKTLRLWDVETGVEVRRFVGHTDWVTTLAISADGRRAISAGPDKVVRVWELTR
jgi:hypothetical protein